MRETAGLTAREAAERVGTTSAQMSHVEAGRTGVSEERLRGMATYYACLDDALIDELVAMAAERDKGWWEEYRGTLAHAALDPAELEHRSRRLRTFQGVYIPGLLQGENYTRALMAYGVPQPSTRQLDALVAFRMRRREVLEGNRLPRMKQSFMKPLCGHLSPIGRPHDNNLPSCLNKASAPGPPYGLSRSARKDSAARGRPCSTHTARCRGWTPYTSMCRTALSCWMRSRAGTVSRISRQGPGVLLVG